jgi:hypothetical protein
MPPAISVTIASDELGLLPGDLGQIDAAVRRFPREALVLRTVSVLNALAALGKQAKNLSMDFAQILPVDTRGKLLSALSKDNALFLEPWQQLVLLRRTLEASPAEVKPELDFLTESGESCYFDICRFASDTLRGPDPFSDQPATADPDAWVKIAANFMPWIWMLNPPDIAAWIARSEIMFRQLPEIDEKVKTRVAALDERFPKALNGLSFTDTTSLIQFLSLWSIRLKPAQIFADPSVIRLNPDTWLKDTDLPQDGLHRLLDRAGSRVDVQLTGAGEQKSPLPFRDRPFLSFSDNSCAPVYPPFVIEKLTPDIFWWLKSLDEDQQLKWQDDWGYVAEAYVIHVFARVAAFGNCKLVPRVETSEGEVDAVILVNGHVALIEITSSSLREAETTSADWELLRDGLKRGFVENPKSKKGPYKEAALQLVRDVRVLLEGKLPAVPKPKKVQRIYPVMVCADRRLRTPGVVNFLQGEFRQRLADEHKPVTADLAVLGLEDVEELESILTATKSLQWGTVRGFLEILRTWDKERGPAPSWWQFVEVMWGRQRRNEVLQQAFTKWRESVANRFPTK